MYDDFVACGVIQDRFFRTDICCERYHWKANYHNRKWCATILPHLTPVHANASEIFLWLSTVWIFFLSPSFCGNEMSWIHYVASSNHVHDLYPRGGLWFSSLAQLRTKRKPQKKEFVQIFCFPGLKIEFPSRKYATKQPESRYSGACSSRDIRWTSDG